MNEIQSLLKEDPSADNARKLLVWADDTRQKILRGDLMIGILSMDEASQIPAAYQTAAEQGCEEAWLKLGLWHRSPDIGDTDIALAEHALQQAVRNNVEDAALELIKLRWFFKRDTATQEEAEATYQLAKQLVEDRSYDDEAVYFLALLTTHGFGCQPSPEEGFKLQQEAAEMGNGDAMFELYIHHSTGLGVPVDEQAALAACQEAAEEEHPRAMYNMGAFNASGKYMPKNIPEAIMWYERAADEDNTSAMLGLAAIYAMGDGVEPDIEYAEEMLDRAEYEGVDTNDFRNRLGL